MSEKSPEVWFVRFQVFALCGDKPLSTNPSSVWGGNRYLVMPSSVTPEAAQKAVFDAMDECVRVVTSQIDNARQAKPDWTLEEPTKA